MTGSVKEEILVRARELGVRFHDGEMVFDSLLLRDAELLAEPTTWTVRSLDGRQRSIELPAGSLGFTVCQVPVVVAVTGGDPCVEIDLVGGGALRVEGDPPGRDVSAGIFGRRGEVRRIRAVVRR